MSPIDIKFANLFDAIMLFFFASCLWTGFCTVAIIACLKRVPQHTESEQK